MGTCFLWWFPVWKIEGRLRELPLSLSFSTKGGARCDCLCPSHKWGEPQRPDFPSELLEYSLFYKQVFANINIHIFIGQRSLMESIMQGEPFFPMYNVNKRHSPHERLLCHTPEESADVENDNYISVSCNFVITWPLLSGCTIALCGANLWGFWEKKHFSSGQYYTF